MLKLGFRLLLREVTSSGISAHSYMFDHIQYVHRQNSGQDHTRLIRTTMYNSITTVLRCTTIPHVNDDLSSWHRQITAPTSKTRGVDVKFNVENKR